MQHFSLHSIGVITFRGRREQSFRAFLQDALPGLGLLHLEKNGYLPLLQAHQEHGLDFDDAYQFALAQNHGLTLVTQDRDFDRIKRKISVRFL